MTTQTKSTSSPAFAIAMPWPQSTGWSTPSASKRTRSTPRPKETSPTPSSPSA